MPDVPSAAVAPSPEGDRHRAAHRPLIEWLIPVIIFAFCIVVGWLTTTFDEAPDIIVGHAMQPRRFPLFLVVVIALLNVVLIAQMLKTEAKPRARAPYQTWATGILMALFYPGVVYIDMFVTLAVIMFAMCVVWGERRIWVAALVALVSCVVIFFSFDLLLQVRFPRGMLLNLYYQ